LLAGADGELGQALQELRELARGIHPAVLTERGLVTALHVLAERVPVPVEVAQLPDGRLPDSIEAAIYYVVAEAITNGREVRAGESGERGRGTIKRRCDGDRERRRRRRRRARSRLRAGRSRRSCGGAGRASAPRKSAGAGNAARGRDPVRLI